MVHLLIKIILKRYQKKSEKLGYLKEGFIKKVTDIYAKSIDYDPKSPISIDFFKRVQNKMHYAVSKQTAVEIIYSRVNSEKNIQA